MTYAVAAPCAWQRQACHLRRGRMVRCVLTHCCVLHSSFIITPPAARPADAAPVADPVGRAICRAWGTAHQGDDVSDV